MERKEIRFSPPDISDVEVEEVIKALKSLVEYAGEIIATNAVEPYSISTFEN